MKLHTGELHEHGKRACTERRLWDKIKSLAAPGNRTRVSKVSGVWVRCSAGRVVPPLFECVSCSEVLALRG